MEQFGVRWWQRVRTPCSHVWASLIGTNDRHGRHHWFFETVVRVVVAFHVINVFFRGVDAVSEPIAVENGQ